MPAFTPQPQDINDCADMGLTVHDAIHLAQDKRRLETIHSQAAVACPCRSITKALSQVSESY